MEHGNLIHELLSGVTPEAEAAAATSSSAACCPLTASDATVAAEEP